MKRLEEYCGQLSEKANDAEFFYLLESELAFLEDAIDPYLAQSRYSSFCRDMHALFRYNIITLNDMNILTGYACDLFNETIRRFTDD